MLEVQINNKKENNSETYQILLKMIRKTCLCN